MRNPFTQRGWPNVSATVTACNERAIVSMRGKQSRLSYLRNYYAVSFRYQVEGRAYNSDFTAYRRYEEGASLAVRFDPTDPQRNSRNDPQGDEKTMLLLTVVCLSAAFLFWLL